MINAFHEAGRIVIRLHRIARAVIEHIPGMQDEIRIVEMLVVSLGPGHLMAVRIADDTDFHKKALLSAR